ncbi:DMT family transporter [Nocardiopsis sp. MG754419]|uniref:DMT family transporter n=1 Tax=Nocardiopsis sp. MG754419 TaxID=2259865 RepID=UPI001BA829C8|nr:DMT family transporter [Nocardiopsis sp. MG754419]MBR8740398.1 EamA family transporter [Nocardiopsis sp. MG754419]
MTRRESGREERRGARPVRDGTGSLLDRIDPTVLAVVGSGCTSANGVFVRLSGANAGTAAFLRCALALVVLVPMALVELRRAGRRPARLLALDAAAGLLLGVDYVFWAASIHHVGAGIATVLLNVQVVVFPLLVWAFLGDRISRGFLASLPVMLVGLALAAGAVGQGTAAHAGPEGDPWLGLAYGLAAGITYAGYLFLSRLAGGRGHTVTPVCVSTATAAVSAGLLGALWSGIDLMSLDARAWVWLSLLALTGQVLTWLLVGSALPRLSATTGAAVLVLPPVMAVLLGALVLGERATSVQLVGCALVVLAIVVAQRGSRTT